MERFKKGTDSLAEEGQDTVYFGKPNPIQEQCFDIQICPDLVLALISLLGAAALLGLYLAATMNVNGKRKRRSLDGSSQMWDEITVGNNLIPLSGLALLCMRCIFKWREKRMFLSAFSVDEFCIAFSFALLLSLLLSYALCYLSIAFA